MKKESCRIIQKHFSIRTSNDELNNYLIVVEIVNDEPRCSYIAPMGNFKFWEEDSPFYVNNNN